jgi:hypothetical protein
LGDSWQIEFVVGMVFIDRQFKTEEHQMDTSLPAALSAWRDHRTRG